jgi:hypothetical protein
VTDGVTGGYRPSWIDDLAAPTVIPGVDDQLHTRSSMTTVPKLGTYKGFTSNGVQFSFLIETANPEPGDIRGTYWTKGSLIGEWESSLGYYPGGLVASERSSSYSWVARVANGVWLNQPPFLMRIVSTASKTEGNLFKKSQHSWTGIYGLDDTVEMMGTECYLEFNLQTGACTNTTVLSLPASTFKMQ